MKYVPQNGHQKKQKWGKCLSVHLILTPVILSPRQNGKRKQSFLIMNPGQEITIVYALSVIKMEVIY